MAKLVADELERFLAHYGVLSWSPGIQVDCGLAIAAWAIWLGRPDPAAHLRGTYQEGQGQIDLLAGMGGAVAIVDDCLSRISCQRTASPVRGDVGVVGSQTSVTRQFCTIHDGSGWLTRTSSGFERITSRTLAAWKI